MADCRYCKGTRVIRYRSPGGSQMVHECTRCNGTGIDGDPRWLLGIFLLIFVLGVSALAWLLAEVFTPS